MYIFINTLLYLSTKIECKRFFSAFSLYPFFSLSVCLSLSFSLSSSYFPVYYPIASASFFFFFLFFFHFIRFAVVLFFFLRQTTKNLVNSSGSKRLINTFLSFHRQVIMLVILLQFSNQFKYIQWVSLIIM